MRVYLKIKIKSLAFEAADIHREERVQNPGARGRIRARRQLKTNELTEPQRRRLERRLAQPSTKRVEAFWGLRNHRVNVVRPEARASLIAYGFLNGLEYRQVEASTVSPPDWERVESLVKKFGYGGLGARATGFEEWRARGEAPVPATVAP